MNTQKAVTHEVKQATAPKTKRAKRAAKVREPAPVKQAEATLADEMQEGAARETNDEINSWPLTPEEDDQLDDVLADMEQHLTEPEGMFPPNNRWQDYEPPVEQYADAPGATSTGESISPIPDASRLQVVEPQGTLIAHCGTRKITREELTVIPVPEATKTHQPIAHHRIVEALIESLSFRHISVVHEEYAVSPDGGRMFGVLDLSAEWNGVRFAIGLRNANDKSMRLGMVVGYRVFVCDNMAFSGDFKPLLAKHTKNFDLVESLSIGVDRIQRGFEPLKEAITFKREHQLSDQAAHSLIYRAFMEHPFPLKLLKTVHREFFVAPSHAEFTQQTVWSLENAFTTAFKELKPVAQFGLTAKLGNFLEPYSQAF